MPHKGKTAVELYEAMHAGEIAGMINICCNPMVSHPDTHFARAALEKLPFFCMIDFFMSETARYADVVLPGSLQEEEEGTTTTAEGRVVRIRAATTPPGNARTDTWILLELARRLGRGDKFHYADNEEIFNELRRASARGTADYAGITWDRVEREMSVFWPCPTEGHPGTPRNDRDAARAEHGGGGREDHQGRAARRAGRRRHAHAARATACVAAQVLRLASHDLHRCRSRVGGSPRGKHA